MRSVKKKSLFLIREAAIFFNGSDAIKEGGGKGRAIKEKELISDGEVPTARGGGG